MTFKCPVCGKEKPVINLSLDLKCMCSINPENGDLKPFHIENVMITGIECRYCRTRLHITPGNRAEIEKMIGLHLAKRK